MKNMIKCFLIYCLVVGLLIACKDVDGKNNLKDLNAKEIEVQTQLFTIYGVVDQEIVYNGDLGNRRICRYNWESGEKSEVEDGVKVLSEVLTKGEFFVFDHKLYCWTTSGNRARDENVVDQFVEIDLKANKISVLYETMEKAAMLRQPMQSFGNELLSILKQKDGFEVVSFHADTRNIEVKLEYEYDFTVEQGESIRAIDTNEENINVLVESRQENREVQYRIDIYDRDYQLVERIVITEIHWKYDWKESTSAFEYSNGYLLHSNGDGNTFFGKVSGKTIHTIYEYSYGYWDEYGDYYENPVYYDVQGFEEYNSEKFFKRMDTAELYQLDLENGQVSCAEIVGQPKGFQMTTPLRIDEGWLLIEFRKYLDEIGNYEGKWYLVEIDALQFKKVTTK